MDIFIQVGLFQIIQNIHAVLFKCSVPYTNEPRTERYVSKLEMSYVIVRFGRNSKWHLFFFFMYFKDYQGFGISLICFIIILYTPLGPGT